MKKRDMYIRASEKIVNRDNFVACAAIKRAGLKTHEFVKIFKPRNYKVGDKWFGCTTIEENQLARSLALLFMAELDK